MSRAVHISGLGIGEAGVQRVAWALHAYHPTVDAFTFAEAMKLKEEGKMDRVLKGAEAYLLSAGYLAVEGSSPKEIHGFGAPIPSSKTLLLARTAAKFVQMHTPGIGIKSLADAADVLEYDATTAAELTVNFVDNVRHLGKIARLNAVASAGDAVRAGIPTRLAYGTQDAYFQLTDWDHSLAEISGVPIHMYEGLHDELALRPHQVLEAYLNAAPTTTL